MADDARFIDALNPKINRLSRLLRKQRLDVCRSCDKFTKLDRCSICGCIMPIKVALPHASCPEGKWGPIEETQ